MNKKLDLKNYILIFIETFNIWQMGVIFYSSKTLAVNNLVHTPIRLDNSILIVLIGYIIGIFTIYLKPQYTILLGKITMLACLLASCTLFLPITANTFSILYYILTFNCVFFISINNSLIVNYYSIKTVLKDVVFSSLTAGLFIAICQNQLIPLSFNAFNGISAVCLFLIVFAFFKLPQNYKPKFIDKTIKAKIPPKNVLIGLIIIHFLASLNTLFTASIAESIKHGTTLSYLGVFIAGLLFILLYKKKKMFEYRIFTLYSAITAIGFLFYLIPINEIKYISLLLQGFGFCLLLITPYFATRLFEKYPSKVIAPLITTISLIAVFFNSIILEELRSNTILLYSIYSFIAVFAVILYLLFEKKLEFNYLDKNFDFNKLTTREKEVAELIIKGYTSKEISKLLFLSEYTVKDYIKSVYKKYNVNSKIKFVNLVNNFK